MNTEIADIKMHWNPGSGYEADTRARMHKVLENLFPSSGQAFCVNKAACSENERVF